MKYQTEKLKMKEVVGGFTERDINSKALLNTDADSFLRYKIQKNKLQSAPKEVEKIRNEMIELKNELSAIKELLSTISKSKP
jgi:hypothetical protein